MIDIRPFASLGHANHGWLDARHHFSFASYHDPERMGWGPIRVWNDDTIAGGSGFPPHPHRDMEIVTFVRSGAITHRDSLGNEGRTAAGDVQVMSAGTGITHAEFNQEDDELQTEVTCEKSNPWADGVKKAMRNEVTQRLLDEALKLPAAMKEKDMDEARLAKAKAEAKAAEEEYKEA